MGDEFNQIQDKIEAVMTLLKSTSDADSRKTYLLKFRVLLDEADKLLLLGSHHEANKQVMPMPKDLS